MARVLTEYHNYSRQQIEETLKCIARMEIIGNIYVNEIIEQEIKWEGDNATVLTKHRPGRF